MHWRVLGCHLVSAVTLSPRGLLTLRWQWTEASPTFPPAVYEKTRFWASWPAFGEGGRRNKDRDKENCNFKIVLLRKTAASGRQVTQGHSAFPPTGMEGSWGPPGALNWALAWLSLAPPPRPPSSVNPCCAVQWAVNLQASSREWLALSQPTKSWLDTSWVPTWRHPKATQ